MDVPRCDFHIHTQYLGCAKPEMTIPAVLAECERLGMTQIGITDHLNRPDQLDLHQKILADLHMAQSGLEIYFGVELNFMSKEGPLALDEDTKEQYGFQFAISGIHDTYLDQYDPKELVDIQHRHHILTCQDPLVDVLVHPYWFGRNEFERKGFPPFESMETVPESYAIELGQTAAETDTAIEINGGAGLIKGQGREEFAKQYVEYLAVIAEQGPMFAIASDAHRLAGLKDAEDARNVADQLGLGPDRIWLPAAEPLFGPGRRGN